MTESTNTSLNLQAPNISTVVYAVQNDKLSRHIVAQLLDGSAPWTPPAGAGAVIRYLKPDGTAGFYDVDENSDPAISVTGSVADLLLVEQAVTVPGDVFMQLNFYGTDGSKLTSFAWILRVQKSVLEDATIISSDYYNVLTVQMTAVLNAAESLTGMTASASGLPTGSDPTVTVTGGSGGTPYNLAFGVPAGPVGPANAASAEIKYQQGDSPSTAPTGTWQSTPPTVAQGKYLWTRTVISWNSGSPTMYYSVARQGVDGQGAPGSATPLSDSGSGVVGTSTNFSREDHRHPLNVSASNPATDGTASPGTAASYARSDHVHGLNVSANNPEALGTASPGTSTAYARADHVHPKLTLYNKLLTATTDVTGNIVLGSDWDSRLIVNIQVSNTLLCWFMGVASASNSKMLHFTDHTGATKASTVVVFRVYWLDPDEFNSVEITT